MDLDAAVDRLKHLDRAGWVLAGHDAPESVAAHSWGMAVRCLQHCPDDLDLATVLSMALVHDLAEAVVGDITPHDGVDKAEKHAKERAVRRIGQLAAQVGVQKCSHVQYKKLRKK